MSHNIKLKPKAYDDLTNIYKYSLKEFGQVKATQYIRSLDETFSKLANDSSIGIDYSDIRPKLLADLAISHIVFFNVQNRVLLCFEYCINQWILTDTYNFL